MGRAKLIQRALRIAQKQHGVRRGLGSREPVNFSQQQQAAKANRLKSLLTQHPTVGVSEVGAAVQLLTCFPEDSQPATRAASSLCTLLGGSAHITPGPALSKILRDSYLKASFGKSSSDDWTRASFQEAWQWVQKGTKEKVREWQEVGVAVEDILGLLQRARRDGRKLERSEYIELLKVCLCIQKGWGSHTPRPLGALMDALVEDCGVEEAWDVLLSGSFQLSTSEADISAVCKSLGRLATLRPRMFHTEQLSAALTADDAPRRVMDLFTQQVLSAQTPPTMGVYESLLSSFARHYQLSWALHVFNTVTTRFRVAPSRTAYNTLTILMTRRAFKGDERVTKKLCHHVLAATEGAYGGRPPLWVYGEMSKPLVQLMGLEGYRLMYERCEDKLDDMGVLEEGERNARLRLVWRQSLYVSLIRGSLVRGDRELALHMLGEIRRWGYVVSTMAYEYLLQSVSQPHHLRHYLPVLLEAMTGDLTWNTGAPLHSPLVKAISNVYKNRSSSSGEVPGFVPAAGRGLLRATLSASTHKSCLEHLEALADSPAAGGDDGGGVAQSPGHLRAGAETLRATQ